ncbi:hypothetical protein CB0940_12010 [Cercospora beticola]|nr:hypothetical protein CB0940_12010 [Cercospora beticola]PIB03141.1 hypothetical protein CB0940_12010 [Cercospora beticola]
MTDGAGIETALSTTATEETQFDNKTIYKSQDAKYAVVYQVATPGQNRSVTLVESSPTDQIQPRLIEFEYEKPGDNITIKQPRLYDLVAKKQIDIGNDYILDTNAMIEDAQWGFRNQTYRYMIAERGYKSLRMVELDTNGNTRILIEEHIEKGIDFLHKIRWDYMNETDQMWWLSERNGWNSIYLVNTTRNEGRISPRQDSIRQVTQDGFDVADVIYVDEKAQVLYFQAYGMVEEQSPYHVHLARINYDGTGFKILTADGDGVHHNVVHDNGTIEDMWSRVDQPMQGVLRDFQGNRIGPLAVNIQLWDNVTLAERFSAPGRDGKTEIYGIIVRPKTFDPSKRYRVLEHVYASPQYADTPKELDNETQKYLASRFQKVADENDVIVVQSDGMGSAWRGRAFRDVAWKNLQDAGFPDRITWIKAAARDRPWMDLTGGVGIFGASAGGQNAMSALIWHSDFYTAAIADAGCHDNRIDKLWWNELNMGWPVHDALYDTASNVVHADKLNGTLLLLVGELDRNVDPSSTLQVVNALNKAGKDFDFMIVPGAGHGVAFKEEYHQVQNKIRRFWKNWKNGKGLG